LRTAGLKSAFTAAFATSITIPSLTSASPIAKKLAAAVAPWPVGGSDREDKCLYCETRPWPGYPSCQGSFKRSQFSRPQCGAQISIGEVDATKLTGRTKQVEVAQKIGITARLRPFAVSKHNRTGFARRACTAFESTAQSSDLGGKVLHDFVGRLVNLPLQSLPFCLADLADPPILETTKNQESNE
jgi:hypothetical protein